MNEEIMLQAPTCRGKNSLIIPIKHVLHVNAQKEKHATKSPSRWHTEKGKTKSKTWEEWAVKVQRGKERVMMSHMRCPGGNPRIPQTQAETLEDQPPHRAPHGTAAHASRAERVYSALLRARSSPTDMFEDDSMAHLHCLTTRIWLIKTFPACLSHISQKPSCFNRKSSVSNEEGPA